MCKGLIDPSVILNSLGGSFSNQKKKKSIRS